MRKPCDSHVTCMSHYTYRIQCMLGNLQVRAQGVGDFAAESAKEKSTKCNFALFSKLDG